jgi:hypothetical protein
MIEVPLTQGKIAFVDETDFYLVIPHIWSYKISERDPNTGYATTNIRRPDGGRAMVRMHRLIMSAPKGVQVDHINGDGLDNRHSNLRLCTQSGNQWNRGVQRNNKSGHKGVSWHKRWNKWYVVVAAHRKYHFGGQFRHLSDAVTARDKLARELHGEFFVPAAGRKGN